MRIMAPLSIGTQLTSSSIAEPDTATGEVAWAASTAYAAGDVRVRATTHRKYMALKAIANTVTTPPESDAANWSDIGPTNRYAMFDAERNTASTVTGTSLSATVTPGVRATTVAVFGLRAETVRLQATSSGSTVYDKTINLSTRSTSKWSEYFFGTFAYREGALFQNVPPNINNVITITLGRAMSGLLSCETVAIGTPVEIGDAQYGATSDIFDFSRIDRDAFGNAALVRRKNVPTLNVQVLAEKSKVPAIRTLREQYAARPLIFLPVADSSDALFDALAMVGIFKRMPIAVQYSRHVLLTIEAEGL